MGSECDKQHVSAASFLGIVRDRDEARTEVEILQAQIRDLETKLAQCAAKCEAEAQKAAALVRTEGARLLECAMTHHEVILSELGTWKVMGANDAEVWGALVREDCEWRRAFRDGIQEFKRGGA